MRPRWKTSAITEEDTNDDSLQDSTSRQTEEQSLIGLVNGLWKLVGTKPGLDNTLTRQKVADVLKELNEQFREATSQESVQTSASKDRDGSGAPRKEKEAGEKSERCAGFQFMRRWFGSVRPLTGRIVSIIQYLKDGKSTLW